MLIELTEKIKKQEPFCVVNFGDGEFNCMRGVQGENCDKHPYSLELRTALIQAFNFLSYKKTYFTDWFSSNEDPVNKKFIEGIIKQYNLTPHFIQPFEILRLGWYTKDNTLLEFWKAVKDSPYKKIFVGNKSLEIVSEMLDARFISIPKTNAFEILHTILKAINYVLKDEKAIIVLSVGMISPVITEHLTTTNDITVLDAGSGFDPLGGSKTRNYQLSPEQTIEYYKCLLSY